MKHKPSYDELTAKMAELEEILRALRDQELDAVVGTKNILMLRLRETEELVELVKKSKELVESQAAQLKATLDAAPAIIWTALDRDCRNITGNRAAYDFSRVAEGTNLSKTGPHPELLINYRILRDGVELPPTELPVQVAARTGQVIMDCALDFHFADGSIRSVFGNVIPLLDAHGCPTGAIGAFLDATDRKRAEMALKEKTQQLEDANKELESFSYSVSHDLCAPLRAIEGFSRMILRKHADKFDEDARSKFNVIIDNTRMMSQLIEDLLVFSHLGKASLTMVMLDMEELIETIWQEVVNNSPDRRLSLKTARIPPCMGDRGLIRQLLTNLLANAVKFTNMRAETLIEVGGEVKDNDCLYYIRDNGIGFDMKFHDKIFEVFQRLHSAAEFEGTGVGLSLVKRIVNRHHVKVWAEGEVDKGATFYFTLPAGKA
jgi:C4-dicarboxylate-specific signal transduction histidine kinase